MKTEPSKTPNRPELLLTAGFGSVAPPWIKADLMPAKLPRNPQHPQPNAPFLWLRRQLGWHPS